MAHMTRLPRILIRAPVRARRRSFAGLMVLLLATGGWVVTSGGVHPASFAAAQTPVAPRTKPRVSPSHPKAKPGGAPRDGGGPLAHLAAQGEPVYCGAGTKPLVALTFDDGPGILSPQALKTLRRTDTPATFFLVGKLFAEPAFVDIAKSEAAAGMAFGDHTWDHIAMTKGNARLYAQQIGRTRHVIATVTGQPVRLFRPPFGAHDHGLDTYVRSQGMLEVLWSIDSGDSQGASVKQIVRTVRKGLSPGDIVILHDNRSTTENALPKILDVIRQRGLTAVTVPDLLTQDPPTKQQLRRHTCG
jgi:peptidoglycan/xylan/chitin deacetylase (PgdA/CDA1 family)